MDLQRIDPNFPCDATPNAASRAEGADDSFAQLLVAYAHGASEDAAAPAARPAARPASLAALERPDGVQPSPAMPIPPATLIPPAARIPAASDPTANLTAPTGEPAADEPAVGAPGTGMDIATPAVAMAAAPDAAPPSGVAPSLPRLANDTSPPPAIAPARPDAPPAGRTSDAPAAPGESLTRPAPPGRPSSVPAAPLLPAHGRAGDARFADRVPPVPWAHGSPPPWAGHAAAPPPAAPPARSLAPDEPTVRSDAARSDPGLPPAGVAVRYLVDAAPMVGGGDHLGRSEADANVTTTTPAVGAIRSAEAGQIATILWRAESAPLVATGPKGEAPPAAVPGAPATPPNAATPSVLRVVCALSPTTALAVQVAAPEDESAVSILPVPVSAHAAAEAEPRPGFAAEERQAPRVEPIAAQPADAAALAASAAPAAKDMAATDIARPAPREAPVHPAVEQVVVHLHRAVAEGSDRITIKLVPAELGRIEIRIEIGPDGQVQAVFAADRPQTLELLQRDARQLERTLDSAGLRTDAGSLSFNLRGEGRTAVPVWTAESRHPGVELTPESPLEAAAPAIAIHARAAGIGERLDIRV